MTVANDMLRTTPSDIGYDLDSLAACIDACFVCAQACRRCEQACDRLLAA